MSAHDVEAGQSSQSSSRRRGEREDDDSTVTTTDERGGNQIKEASERMTPHAIINSTITSNVVKVVISFKEHDPDNPMNLSIARKWLIVLIVSASSLCVTSCSSMASSVYAEVESEFNVSREKATLSLSIFIAGLGIGPLLLSPLSELYGRNPVYRWSFLMFLIWNIPVAFAQNYATYLIGRFLTGFSGSAFLSVAGGTVSDLFSSDQVAGPMAVYTASPFVGPVVGPLLGDFIAANTDWRWIWYVQLIWCAVQLAFLFVYVPETYGKIILKRRVMKTVETEKMKGEDVKAPPIDQPNIYNLIIFSCKTPFIILVREPMALLLCIWTAFLLGVLYAFFSAFPIVFAKKGFSREMLGLSFVPIGSGSILAAASYPYFNRTYAATAKRLGHAPPPEEHLRKGMWGAPLVPISLFWFAWTSQASVHWIAPMLASVLFGAGVVLIFQAVFTFLVSAYRPVAASAMGANTFLRCAFGTFFPLFTVQMYDAMTPEWASTLIAFIALLLAPLPFIFYKKGASIRQKSQFSHP